MSRNMMILLAVGAIVVFAYFFWKKRYAASVPGSQVGTATATP